VSYDDLSVGTYVKVDPKKAYLSIQFEDAIKKYDDVVRINVLNSTKDIIIGVPYDTAIETNLITLDAIIEIAPKPSKIEPLVNAFGVKHADITLGTWIKVSDKIVNLAFGDIKEKLVLYDKTVVISKVFPSDINKFIVKTPYSGLEFTITFDDITMITTMPDVIVPPKVYEPGQELAFHPDKDHYATTKGYEFMKAHNFIAELVMILDDDTVVVKTSDGKKSAVASEAIIGEAKDLIADVTEATVEEIDGEVVFKQGDKTITFNTTESEELKTWLVKQ